MITRTTSYIKRSSLKISGIKRPKRLQIKTQNI